jgi:hypothetical protein
MKKYLFAILISIFFSGCMGAVLFGGSVVGLAYVKQDLEENYGGDTSYYFEDKYNRLKEDSY